MPLANLYLSIMQAFGLNVSTFGSVERHDRPTARSRSPSSAG